MDLGLGAAVQPRKLGRPGHQLVTERDGLLVLVQVLDEQLDAVQVGGDELRIGAHRALELVERLVDLALVPEDLAATVVRFGALRLGSQRLVEPRERFFGAPAVGRLHRLIQTIPIAVFFFHLPVAGKERGGPDLGFVPQDSRYGPAGGAGSLVGAGTCNSLN